MGSMQCTHPKSGALVPSKVIIVVSIRSQQGPQTSTRIDIYRPLLYVDDLSLLVFLSVPMEYNRMRGIAQTFLCIYAGKFTLETNRSRPTTWSNVIKIISVHTYIVV